MQGGVEGHIWNGQTVTVIPAGASLLQKPVNDIPSKAGIHFFQYVLGPDFRQGDDLAHGLVLPLVNTVPYFSRWRLLRHYAPRNDSQPQCQEAGCHCERSEAISSLRVHTYTESYLRQRPRRVFRRLILRPGCFPGPG